jgi:predicted nucleotidyltransferase
LIGGKRGLIVAISTMWQRMDQLWYDVTMRHAEAISLLKSHEAELKQLGVEHLYIFGSTARNEARNDSDIDLFFDHARGQLGVYELMDVKSLASSILGRSADVMTRASLHPMLRKRIEESAVLVF